MNISRFLTISILSLAMLPAGAFAQAPAAGTDPNRRGGPTAAQIEEYRKRFEEGTKTALKATDEEWTVLKPLIENVNTKLREARTSSFGRGGGSTSGGGSTGGSETPRPGQAESQALKDALASDATSVEDIKAKLTALRNARKGAQAALAQAREELRKVLTVRQEAALVNMGLLE
jgi:Spy/CpxP family protein refolding chaperone